VTYSIVARDSGTGEMGVATQSQAFAVGNSVPSALPGHGAIATQSMLMGPGPQHRTWLRPSGLTAHERPRPGWAGPFTGSYATATQLFGRAPARSAPSRSWLSREIVSIEMPLGHAWEHSPMLVQPPKPSRSCWATMLTTRSLRSG
jgi:hypothetical protein